MSDCEVHSAAAMSAPEVCSQREKSCRTAWEVQICQMQRLQTQHLHNPPEGSQRYCV